MSDTINPIDYGVLPSGFSRMRLPEIRQSIIDSLQAKTQLIFETRPDSITGQFIDVFAEREAAVWELAQAVYHAMYPISAYGVNLDHSVAFAGVVRLFALQSLVWVNLYGVQGTVVPAGSVIRSETNREDFQTMEDRTIDGNAAGDITFSVDTAVTAAVYTISVTHSGEGTVTATYTAIAGDSIVDIAGHLAPLLLTATYVSVQDANHVHVYRIDGLNFQGVHSANISFFEIGSTVMARAVNYGLMEIPIGSITQIVSTLDGWDRVNNVTPGQSGRETETDDQLRLRYAYGVYRLGAGTIRSIQANLEQNILGLISVMVYENNLDIADPDGRPSHSIEVVAYGGDPQSVAEEIFRVKPAGISTFGSVSLSVSDSNGYTHVIKFNRPAPIYIWMNLTITKYSEETFPSNGDELIKQIVVDTGNTFGVGKDIIHQRFMGPIYSQIAGIGNIAITSAVSASSTVAPAGGSYTSANKTIAVRELSRFDLTRVVVTVV